jgi:hypothetical protein
LKRQIVRSTEINRTSRMINRLKLDIRPKNGHKCDQFVLHSAVLPSIVGG